jgi:hypothetical protein
MKLLGIYPMFQGFDLLGSARLDPRLERDTFSGGVNLTRRARNLLRIGGSLDLAVLQAEPKVIVGSRLAIAALKVAVEQDVKLPASAHPAVLEWFASLVRRLGDKELAEMIEGARRGR